MKPSKKCITNTQLKKRYYKNVLQTNYMYNGQPIYFLQTCLTMSDSDTVNLMKQKNIYLSNNM